MKREMKWNIMNAYSNVCSFISLNTSMFKPKVLNSHLAEVAFLAAVDAAETDPLAISLY